MTEKCDGTIVIHLSKTQERQFLRLAERNGLNKSEYGRELIARDIERHRNDFEYMKTIFEPE